MPNEAALMEDYCQRFPNSIWGNLYEQYRAAVKRIAVLEGRIDAAMKHLPTDRDLTDTEAEIALELVEPAPLSEQRIAEIVEYATGRAATPGKADDTPAKAD